VSDKATDIANLLAPTVVSLGLELLGVEYLPAPGGATLRLYIDVPLAEQPERIINVDDCERVSREVSAQLDVEDRYMIRPIRPQRPIRAGLRSSRYARAFALRRCPGNGWNRDRRRKPEVECRRLIS